MAVIKRDNVLKTVSEMDSKTAATLTQNKVQEIYNRLYPCSQTSIELRQKHVDSIHGRIRQKFQEKDIVPKQLGNTSSEPLFSETKNPENSRRKPPKEKRFPYR